MWDYLKLAGLGLVAVLAAIAANYAHDLAYQVNAITVMLAAGIGSALEWYDYFIYGMASALVFGPLFFPAFDPATGVMASFATFAVGFLARPFGGLFFGHFGVRL